MQKIIFLLFLLPAAYLTGQTNYTNLTDWQSAINVNNSLRECAFEDFATDGDYSSTPLALNGFTIVQSAGTPRTENKVESGQMESIVEQSPVSELTLTFTQANVRGFFAEFASPGSQGGLLLVYDKNKTMMAQYDLSSVGKGRAAFGFINDQAIGSIEFKAASATMQEFFIMDNVRVVCYSPTPIPTFSQWGLLLFGLGILNMGIFFVQKKYTF